MTINGPAPISTPAIARTIRPTPPPAPSEVGPATKPGAIDPPVGVDRELWNVLTTDEQHFFAQQSALGPLTYGPSEVKDADAPLGQRVDVRA